MHICICIDGFLLFEKSTNGTWAIYLTIHNFKSEIRNTLGIGTYLVGLIPPLPDRGYKQRNWSLYFQRIAQQLKSLFTHGLNVFVACKQEWETIRAILLFICCDIRGNKMLDNAQAPSLFGACDNCDIQGFQISRGLTIYPYHCRCYTVPLFFCSCSL
jgi:hypothetical protein